MTTVFLLNVLLATFISAKPLPVVVTGGTATCMSRYNTTQITNVTETRPNGGWVDFSGNTCSAGSQACTLGEQTGTSKTVQIGVDFGGGPEFDLEAAVASLGLDFGVSVAYTTETDVATTESCNPSGDDGTPCICGLQYQPMMVQSQGTITSTGGSTCQGSATTFNVTAPQTADGHAIVHWRACVSSFSTCKTMPGAPICGDGL